jgi:hypothetical protein
MSSTAQEHTDREISAQSQFWLRIVTALWLIAAVAGLSMLWKYDNAPGVQATAPERWPASSALARTPGQPTLILLAHPQCSCTPASLAELAEVLARASRRPSTYILFLKPEGFANGWEQTGLWKTAASIPGVTLVRDDEGREAQRFGSATSGQTLLYDGDGTLRFNGGITGSRAHAGDNAGRRSLVALLGGERAERAVTSVFGCPLFVSGL